MKNVFAAALQRLTRVVLLRQYFGNAVILPLAALWLLIPDSHAWQFAVALLSALALVAAFLYLHLDTLRRLRQGTTCVPAWAGMLLLTAWLGIFRVLADLVARIDNNADARAGYWNSQLGPHWRTIFTFNRLLEWQGDLVTVLTWAVLPALILPLLIETVTQGSCGWRNGLRVLLRWQHWLTVVVASYLALWLTGLLFEWLPGRSVKGELISIVLRFALIYTIDLALLLATLAVTAELLSRNNAARQSVT